MCGTVSEEQAADPVLPDYGGACLDSVVPALLGHVMPDEATGAANATNATRTTERPEPAWLPEAARRANQIVLLVVDGMGWSQVEAARDSIPTLSSGEMVQITSVVPTTTATALTSISTGLPPASHGIVGYRLAITGSTGSRSADRRPVDTGPPGPEGAAVLNVLKWRTEHGDARLSLPPRKFQPSPAFCGLSVPSVTRADFAATGFSAAHLDSARIIGWQVPSTLVVAVRELLAAGTPFVHAYYDGPDKVAHEHGLDEHYAAELRALDRLVADLLEVLPRGACLVVTSDHGQVQVGSSARLPSKELLEASWLISGEGRFRWFHARSGAHEALHEAATSSHGHEAWVRTLEQIRDEGWFGGPLSTEVAGRLGDVALVAREPVAFLDPADTGETRLAARHGSLTAAEMYVPLVALAPAS